MSEKWMYFWIGWKLCFLLVVVTFKVHDYLKRTLIGSGYQPTNGGLDFSDPPRGGSGVLQRIGPGTARGVRRLA